jgi:MFS family permease
VFGEAKLVWAGFFSMATELLSVSLAPTRSPLLVIASTIGSFGTGVIRPALTALVSQAARAEEQGAALGATQSLVSIGQVLAPLISGAIIDSSKVNASALRVVGLVAREALPHLV